MSFEGYYQLICKNGHYETHNCYADSPEFWRCGFCNEKCAWWNLVDLTNGSYDGNGNRIDGYVHLPEVEVFACRCDKCGIVHKVKPSVYKIPEGKGHLYEPST